MYWTPAPYGSIKPGHNAIGAYTYTWNRNGLPLGDSKKGLPVGGTVPTRTDKAAGMGKGESVGFIRGQWNRIQMHIKPNTVPGDGGASGITELWVNGVKTLSNNLIEYIPLKSEQNYQLAANESPNNYRNIRSFTFFPYHGGGSNWNTPDDIYYYVDNMTVSTQYIP
jgi:hypothetical protein